MLFILVCPNRLILAMVSTAITFLQTRLINPPCGLKLGRAGKLMKVSKKRYFILHPRRTICTNIFLPLSGFLLFCGPHFEGILSLEVQSHIVLLKTWLSQLLSLYRREDHSSTITWYWIACSSFCLKHTVYPWIISFGLILLLWVFSIMEEPILAGLLVVLSLLLVMTMMLLWMSMVCEIVSVPMDTCCASFIF